jgi:hypothetical protein
MIPNLEDEPPLYDFSWGFVSFFIMCLVAFRIVFQRGIRFGTETENATGLYVILSIILIILTILITIGIRNIRQRRRRVYEMVTKSLSDAEMIDE